ncbi:unnamed protein product [Phaeothamnion confervicola]
MLASLIAVATGVVTIYSGPNAPDPRIEASTDRGPIIEFIVRCPAGTAIISYSKMEGLFCDPRLVCEKNKDVVIRRSCG